MSKIVTEYEVPDNVFEAMSTCQNFLANPKRALLRILISPADLGISEGAAAAESVEITPEMQERLDAYHEARTGLLTLPLDSLKDVLAAAVQDFQQATAALAPEAEEQSDTEPPADAEAEATEEEHEENA